MTYEVWNDWEVVLRTEDREKAEKRYDAEKAQARATKAGEMIVLREVTSVELDQFEAELSCGEGSLSAEPVTLLFPLVTVPGKPIEYAWHP